MKLFYRAFYILLMFVLFFAIPLSAPVSADNISDILDEVDLEEMEAAEIEELMRDILHSSEQILSSQPNVTVATQLLAALPEREDKPSLAVYHISDRTGQVKELGSSVVTQGATDMLITALIRSRQFDVLGRVNFSDLMNEQNLQGNQRLAAGEGPTIGQMTGADYILEGAITEYQVDMETGGLGISLGGLGGTSQHARASTALDLRVLDTTTGEVVWAQSLKGEIEGKKVGLQAFSFMGNNIVEFETGRGKQEVMNLVVRTLLEEAVYKLVQSSVF